jgi:hypothetical protein
MMKRKMWVAALAVAAGCGTTDPTQLLTGKVDTTADAIAVRAVDGTRVVAAAEIADDSSFALAVPAGTYQLEMLTRTGVRTLLTSSGGGYAALTFQVCSPGAPWNIGQVGNPGGNLGSGSGQPPPPPPGCDNNTGSNCPPPPPPPPGCGPDSNGSDQSCPPPGCDANGSGQNCPPPPPPMCGPNQPAGSDCWPPPPPTCGSADANGSDCVPPPPPPCNTNSNGSACSDPCGADPTSCGCAQNEPNCWPPPGQNGGGDSSGMLPSNPPGNFGCTGG